MNTLKILLAISVIIYFSGCKHIEKNPENTAIEADPIVKDGGNLIEFPVHSSKASFFKTIIIDKTNCLLDFSAPATVIGRVNKSDGKLFKTIILFNSPDITTVYFSYLQNLDLLKTAKINFERVNDLFKNGAATGKELNDASAELMNIQNAIAGFEAQLRESGLSPNIMKTAPLGTVWLICDLPESELNMIKKKQKYKLEFPSFPNEQFNASIDMIADVMNTDTRKIKVRLSLIDKEEKIKPGMYAKVKFEAQHVGLMIPKKSLISANAKYYVYIKKNDLLYERREVTISSETEDFIEIASGIQKGEQIVATNVYLLKGINMGI